MKSTGNLINCIMKCETNILKSNNTFKMVFRFSKTHKSDIDELRNIEIK